MDPTPPPTGADALSVAQAARLVNRSPACLFRWMLSGRLRWWRLGRRRVLARADVLALLEPGGSEAPPPAERTTRREADRFTEETLRRHGLL